MSDRAGPRVMAMRMTNGELSDRLRLVAIHPRRFSAEENTAIIEEAADRLDTKSEVVEVEYPNGQNLWKFVVNGKTYWFTESDKAHEFRQKVESL